MRKDRIHYEVFTSDYKTGMTETIASFDTLKQAKLYRAKLAKTGYCKKNEKSLYIDKWINETPYNVNC